MFVKSFIKQSPTILLLLMLLLVLLGARPSLIAQADANVPTITLTPWPSATPTPTSTATPLPPAAPSQNQIFFVPTQTSIPTQIPTVEQKGLIQSVAPTPGSNLNLILLCVIFLAGFIIIGIIAYYFYTRTRGVS